MNTNNLKQVCLSVSRKLRDLSHSLNPANGVTSGIADECSRRPTAVNEKIVESVSIQARIACLCGATERIVLPHLHARRTCAACGRTYGIRSVAYTCLSRHPDPATKVNVSVGYVITRVPVPPRATGVM